MQTPGAIYEFGQFRLEVDQRRLLRDGEDVPIRAKVFDTLLTLVVNGGNLVTKDALMRAVWPDAVVEEGNLAHNLTELRKALGERGSGQEHIQTVSGKGYRFTATVRIVAKQPRDAGLAAGWEQRLAAARVSLAAKAGEPADAPAWDANVVGREAEIHELFTALDDARRGRAQLICITGEPGIGKSTLAGQFAAECAARREVCAFATGRCSERLAGSEAYLPILEALETLLQGPWGAECGELLKLAAPTWYVRVAPLWASAEPSFASIVADARAASLERLKRELAAFFGELSNAVPVVLFLDDLHWADASTVEMLAYLARKMATARLLTIAAYRPSDMKITGHPFIALQQELQRQNLCRELPMNLLRPAHIEQYLHLEIPAGSLPDGFAEVVHGRTEGNPLFMTEMIRHLREGGRLQEPSSRLDLPESVRSMIERRVSHLDQDQLELLAIGAVQGQEFDSRIIADVLQIDPAVVEERLRELDRVHAFVRKTREHDFPDSSVSVSYTFAHILYLHALDETLTPSRRAALSRAAGEALLMRNQSDPAPVAARLAMLFEAGRDFERAADFFIAAAANAARLYANEVAVTLSRRAIANAEHLRDKACHQRVAAAAQQLGQLQMVLSRFPDAAADFERAEAAAALAGDVEAQVNAICARALAAFYQRRMQETREIASHALAIAEAAGSQKAAAAAEAVLGLEQLCYGATDKAEERFERSVPVLLQHTPSPHALETITFSGLLRAWQLDYAGSRRITDWTMRHAREQGLASQIVLNLFVRGMTKFNEGRLSEGIQDLEEGMRLAEKNGERFWLSRFPNTLGWVYRELQDLETAMRLDTLGAQTARENGYAKPEAYSHVNLAQDHMAAGETGPVLDHLNRATELFGEDVWFRWRYHMRAKAELARYWLLKGDTGQAREYALESVAIAEPRKTRKHLAWAHKILGDVASAEERMDEAQASYETAIGLLDRYRNPLIEWRVLLAASESAAARKDSDLADQYRGRCRQVILHLAESLTDEKLRRQFLDSEAIRKALA